MNAALSIKAKQWLRPFCWRVDRVEARDGQIYLECHLKHWRQREVATVRTAADAQRLRAKLAKDLKKAQ